MNSQYNILEVQNIDFNTQDLIIILTGLNEVKKDIKFTKSKVIATEKKIKEIFNLKTL
jgi:hypothetical protein